MKIEIKNRFTGKIIFETSTHRNIKAAILEAIKEGANLEGADLCGANLCGADLRSANLYGAKLRSANLEGADLLSANLEGADLEGAENKEKAYVPMFCKWSVTLFGDKIKIGCETKSIKEWDAFFKSEEQLYTKRDTEQFNQIHAMYKAIRVYKIQLKKFNNKETNERTTANSRQ